MGLPHVEERLFSLGRSVRSRSTAVLLAFTGTWSSWYSWPPAQRVAQVEHLLRLRFSPHLVLLMALGQRYHSPGAPVSWIAFADGSNHVPELLVTHYEVDALPLQYVVCPRVEKNVQGFDCDWAAPLRITECILSCTRAPVRLSKVCVDHVSWMILVWPLHPWRVELVHTM